MALTAIIDGVSRGIRALDIKATQNGKDSLYCELDSVDGSVVVDIDEEISIVEDSLTIYGGSIKTPSITGKGDAVVAITNKINALDFNELGDRDMIFGMTIPGGGTTRAALQAILDAGYLPGVTNGMPNSPDTSPVIADEMTFDEMYVDAALEEISVRSQWLREINYSKVASFFAPGSRAAPWNVADGDGNARGNVTVSKSRVNYINRWVVKFTAAATSAYAFLNMPGGNFVDGETVEVGGRTYPMLDSPSAANEVQIGASVTASLNNLISAIVDGVGGGLPHATVGALLQSSSMMQCVALTAGASGNNIAVATDTANGGWITEGGGSTATLLFGSDEALTNRVIRDNLAEQALYGRYTGIAEAANVRLYSSAEALGDMLLESSIVTVTRVTYSTYRSGLFPGMTQTIQNTRRFLNNTCLITEVNTKMLEGSLMKRDITAIFNSDSGTGDTYRSTPWRDEISKWSGKKAGATTVGGSGGGGGGSLASKRVYLLQSSSNTWVQAASGGDWVPADGSTGGEGGLEVYLDPAELGTTTGVVFLRMRAASGNVTARLHNPTTAHTAGTSGVISTSTLTRVAPFAISFPTAGWYRLELSPSVAGIAGRVNGLGYLEC
jgi:hypothetical protein